MANFVILLTDEQSGLLQFAYQAAAEPEAVVQYQAQIIAHAQTVLQQQKTLAITRPAYIKAQSALAGGAIKTPTTFIRCCGVIWQSKLQSG